jgi:hypothetical protein
MVPIFSAIGLIINIAGKAMTTAYIQFLGHTDQNKVVSDNDIKVTQELISIVMNVAVIKVVKQRKNVSFFII